jgi:hypothetical protein
MTTSLSEAKVIDFNSPASSDINDAINTALDAASEIEQREERRTYLGAAGIGSECLRKVQFDWQRVSAHAARTKRIFKRGHDSEEKIAAQLMLAGFTIERGTDATGFTAVDGAFRGHADGIIRSGPAIDGLKYPCLWEAKCLGSSGWKKIEKHGLRSAYPVYEMQVALYQAYLGLDENPALFTVENADTCHVLALTVPFDADVAQAASDKAVAVIKATQAGELLPRITDKGPTDWRCKMCQHSEFCWSLND